LDPKTLTSFLGWCTVINTGLLILASLFLLLIPDFVYQVHSYWFDISRDAFNTVMYAILAFFKVFILLFNLVPWVVLRIIRKT
jgi:hypothetical protein